MRKPITILILCLGLFQYVNAQEDSSAFDEVVSFHPYHLVNSGIRIDYDRQLGSNHWLQICPQFYASERNDNEYRDFKELMGVGLSVYHRIYVGNNKPTYGTYFSYGLTYNRFNLKYDPENSLADVDSDETNINKFGADVVMGYQFKFFERMILDMYVGLGGRYADRSYKGNTHRKFDEFLYDYGYTGNVILTGVRIGFGF